ncbi:hypothetical protein WMF37_48300 [Sorangium sp. So ce291]|uniref:hypothetical protein n=1 Tax=Sorangium sp. So ce291 TaxID=3133294 RepID=UPI003F63444B
MSNGAWEAFVRAHFPGYLLPSSRVEAITAEEAARFLARITGRDHELALLRSVSTLAPRIDELRVFAMELLPHLARNLPSRSDVTTRDWRGGFRGRLDVRRTSYQQASGDRSRYVTQARDPSFALPENILVRAVAERLLRLLIDLRKADVLAKHGWGADAQGAEGELRRILSTTALREVPSEPIAPQHELSAQGAVHRGYGAALAWHKALRQGLDATDASAIAAVLAEGALTPIEKHTRFEIAVVIRLLQALWTGLEAARGAKGERFEFHRSLVHAKRDEVASFERGDGARVQVYYNQCHLDPGPRDEGAKHYMGGRAGRLRPDVTVVVEKDGQRRAAVIEIKLTEDSSYVLQGFHEAIVYRWEYAGELRGWPKAILVTSANVPGAVRVGDDVIAVGWANWVPEAVVEGLLEGV